MPNASELTLAFGALRLSEFAPRSFMQDQGEKSISLIMDDYNVPVHSPHISQAQQNTIKCGWLRKQGGFVKTWHTRWFVLKGDQLHYFKDEDEMKPLACPLLHAYACAHTLFWRDRSRIQRSQQQVQGAVQSGSVPVERGFQSGIPDPVPKLPEVLSGVRGQARLRNSSTQTGDSNGSGELGLALVPEPVLGGGQVVRVKEGFLTVPVPVVAPRTANNKTVGPEVQDMWVEPNTLCWSRTKQVKGAQEGITWVEGCQSVSKPRPKERGTRDRQEDPMGKGQIAETEENQVGEKGQVPMVGSYSLWPRTQGRGCNNKEGLSSVPPFYSSSALDPADKDPKEKDFRPKR
ncbi:hypothetical protein XELAEV_18005942mg [Xenopus laevis]|uniref:PH domain-containing protein n=1 Tax=Xenopus laevis TaxID=8355 RepID=A0A974DYY1_XENLA|nr:hypothetical protein XELAEV_18005942mg [Xenopus laevis]